MEIFSAFISNPRFFQILHHRIKGTNQKPKLISPSSQNLYRKIALGNTMGCLGKLGNGVGYTPCKRDGDNHRHQKRGEEKNAVIKKRQKWRIFQKSVNRLKIVSLFFDCGNPKIKMCAKTVADNPHNVVAKKHRVTKKAEIPWQFPGKMAFQP